MRSLFESSYTAIDVRFNVTRDGQQYYSDVSQLMRDILSQKCSRNHSEVSKALHDGLSSRWNQRGWFVVVYSRSDGTLAGNEDHSDASFYYAGLSTCKFAAAISFPTGQNTQTPVQFDTDTETAIDNYYCDKHNQDDGHTMVSSMHTQVDPVCPGVNVAAVATEYIYDEDFFGADWAAITYVIKTSSGVDERTKQCNNKNDNIDDGNTYRPYHIFNLPPTRPYTIPEEEYFQQTC